VAISSEQELQCGYASQSTLAAGGWGCRPMDQGPIGGLSDRTACPAANARASQLRGVLVAASFSLLAQVEYWSLYSVDGQLGKSAAVAYSKCCHQFAVLTCFFCVQMSRMGGS